MKKKNILIIFAILLTFLQNVHAREISLIYINGSDNNSPKTKDWYFKGIEKFHVEMKKAFENDDFSCKKLLKNGQYTIKEDPIIFFWGDMSEISIQELHKKLNYAKVFTPKVTQFTRELFAYWIHDAIWVSKYHNMLPITDKLHEEVMAEYNKGNEVILYGYSAGSFVSYNYMLQKSKYIDPIKFVNTIEVQEDTRKFISSTKSEKTCSDALTKSKLAFISASGDVIFNQNLNQIKEIYPTLDQYSEKYCLPDDALLGVVNYASPFSLFYSEIADLSRIMTIKSKLLYIYIIESNKFLITTNWANDPLSFPTAKNLTFGEAENLINVDLTPDLGFVYDKSDQKSHSIFLFAHNSYWNDSKRFAQNIVKAYKDGYSNYYK